MESAIFYRFPFSAQETFRADAGYAASTTIPPSAPNTQSAANTHLFRRGVRVLSTEQTTALAEAVVAHLREKFAASGPYRSLEEFLDPSPLLGGSSLLERAIADVVTSDRLHLNDPATIPEFSSQWLTRGSLLSLLAPVLFVRSDTFQVRAYGDAVNPVTGAIEGRAWCEAMVQRLPAYFDATQPRRRLRQLHSMRSTKLTAAASKWFISDGSLHPTFDRGESWLWAALRAPGIPEGRRPSPSGN